MTIFRRQESRPFHRPSVEKAKHGPRSHGVGTLLPEDVDWPRDEASQMGRLCSRSCTVMMILMKKMVNDTSSKRAKEISVDRGLSMSIQEMHHLLKPYVSPENG